jgi:hypothetical protein
LEVIKVIPSTVLITSRLAKSKKKLKRMVNHAKPKAYRREPFWHFGVLVPRTHAQAIELDKANGNTKLHDAEVTERRQLLDYNIFF